MATAAKEGRYDSPAAAFAAGVKIVGSGVATARLLGVTQPTVWRWLKAGKACPADHVPRFSDATGIPREQLRPDLFGPATDKPIPHLGARA